MRVMTLDFIDCQELAVLRCKASLGHHESKLKRIPFANSSFTLRRYSYGSKEKIEVIR